MLTMPAPIRQHLSGNVGRVRLRAAGWSRGGAPRRDPHASPTHRIDRMRERRVVSFSKN